MLFNTLNYHFAQKRDAVPKLTGTTSILYFLIVTVAGRRRHFIIIHNQKVFEV